MRGWRSILLTLVALLAIALADPVADAPQPRIPDAWRDIAAQASRDVGPWTYRAEDDPPRSAFRTRHEVVVRRLVFRHRSGGPRAMAVLQIVLAADRRDLLAYEPAYALPLAGWRPAEPDQLESRSMLMVRGEGPLAERIRADHQAVLPGRVAGGWRQAIRAEPIGPGWPGPAAAVQVFAMQLEPPDYDRLTDAVRALAERLGEAEVSP
ncbi:MAG: hypothetical protein AAFX79_07415 [Planctomycetota bacterium]